jgi:hydrogenase 3 maturation protease
MKELILGIGNNLKGDDGVGPYVVGRLNDRLCSPAATPDGAAAAGAGMERFAIDCGMVPENSGSVVRQHGPHRVLLVDAAEMGLPPGSARAIPPEKAGLMCVSTHRMPLSLFVSYLKEFCPNVVLIGIQPERIELGAAMSREVIEAADRLAALIAEGRLSEIRLLEN